MKKILFYAAAVALAMTSCQQEDFQPSIAADGEGNFNITIDAPEAMGSTRTYTLGSDDALFGPRSSSALGGLTNVDWTQYDLRYKVVVYQKNAVGESSFDYVPVLTRTEIVDTYQGITMSFRLTTNRTYRVVAWADFVEQGTIGDLHYDTSDLTHVTCLDDTDHMLNDESRDAYYARRDYTIGGEDQNVNILLRRPFAKIRFVTTDWALDDLEMPDEFTVTYKNCSRYYGFNALTGGGTDLTGLGDAGSEYALSCKGKINKDVKEYALNYDQTDRNRTLVVDYLFAGAALNAIHMDFTPTGLATRSIDVDIPTRQNFLTTILGNLLTGNMSVTFEIDEMFTDEFNGFDTQSAFSPVQPNVDAAGVYHIKLADELAWISENVSSLSAATVVLDNDIDLMGINWKPINTSGKISLFDGQGHTIYNLAITGNKAAVWGYDENKYFGLFGNASLIHIQNLNIENVSINNFSGHAGGIVGCLGLGGTGSNGNLIKNCNVKHIFIRQMFYDEDRSWTTFNGGAIVGINDGGDLEDCHAEDVNIQCGWRAGGLVGYTNAYSVPYNGDFKYINCSVKDAILWNTMRWYDADPDGYDTWQLHQIGSITGCIDGVGNNIYLENCTQTNCTYVWGGHASSSDQGWITSNLEDWSNDIYNIHGIYILHSGDEAPSGTYTITMEDGAVIPYGPLHPLFGQACDCTVYVNGVEDHSGDIE
ncbi:MAG: DUF6562 domain-containing protein [Lepagella sp.]